MKQLSCLMIILAATMLSANVGNMHPKNGNYSPVLQNEWRTAAYPLGSYFQGNSATFAVYSKNATRVLLEIYDKASGVDAKHDYWMERGQDNIWRAKITCNDSVVYYGFRLWGPNWAYDERWKRGNSDVGFIVDFDNNANRFNPNKVVYDPYSRELSHDKSNPKVLGNHTGEMFGTGDALYKNVVRRNFDTGKWVPKSLLFRNHGGTTGVKPRVAQQDSIIYEAHVRGITKHHSSARLGDILSGIPGMESVRNIPEQYLGTYKGAGYFAQYLKALGFTTIELLPVHETDNDANPNNSPGGNYWGYQSFSYFAPDRRYAFDKSPGGPTREFKEMVKAFHDAGLEVYLDVVYNHTGEGGAWDKTGKTAEIVGFRGLDNSEYYAIPQGAPGAYWETTGCGNNFDSSKAIVRKMIIDSLYYWIEDMGVDGFRFDLATVLGRDRFPNYQFNRNAQLLKDIALVQQKTDAEMIAEAWDIGTYQVGSFPRGWGEWNGVYRDAVRRFVKGGGAQTGFADVFNGTFGLFSDQGGPHKSVNFITAHDGFTLMDLVSYNQKNNKIAWPFGPSDGGNDSNDAWDHNGDHTLRRQQLRNFWTIQTFARGIPMAVWGDEFARTQNGNNNPYNVDSVCTWNNYFMISTDSPTKASNGSKNPYHDNFGKDTKVDNKNGLFLFVKEMLHVRQQHHSLRQTDYRVSYNFAKADGGSLQGNDRAMRIHIDGSAVGDSDFLILINTWTEKIDFNVFAADSGKTWYRISDTASWAETENNFWGSNQTPVSGNYGVSPWSIVVLQSK